MACHQGASSHCPAEATFLAPALPTRARSPPGRPVAPAHFTGKAGQGLGGAVWHWGPAPKPLGPEIQGDVQALGVLGSVTRFWSFLLISASWVGC